jgi:hypothetical protein
MVQTITPVVHGRHRLRYVAAAGLHVGGAGASGGVLGLALGGLGALLGAPWGRPAGLVLAAIAVLYALRETGAVPVPAIAARRQVPEWWRTFYSPPTAALLYGLGLGVGFATYLSHGTFVVVCAACVLTGNPLAGMALAALFGVTRALSAALAGAGGRPALAVARLDDLASSPLAPLANALVLAAVAIASLLA